MRASVLLLTVPLAFAMPFLEIEDMEPQQLEGRQATVSIDKLMKQKGKLYFGTCTDQGRLGAGKNAAIIDANFGQVTPENSMKWESIERTEGQFSWAQADYLVDWAVEHNKTIRGHTLVWHSQLASWVNNKRSKADLIKTMQAHISTIVGRWKGKIRAWVS
jgi:endo-1,4-beta-xylanase